MSPDALNCRSSFTVWLATVASISVTSQSAFGFITHNLCHLVSIFLGSHLWVLSRQPWHLAHTLAHTLSLPRCNVALAELGEEKQSSNSFTAKVGLFQGSGTPRIMILLTTSYLKGKALPSTRTGRKSLVRQPGTSNVPALPASREKDFMRLLIQLLAANFQARFCRAKSPCSTLQMRWSHEKNFAQISSIS